MEKKKMMKKILIVLLAGALAASAVACATTPTDENSSGAVTSGVTSGVQATKSNFPGTVDPDMVTMDLRTEPPNLNPITTTDATSGNVLRLTTAGLMKLDANDKPVVDLAESYTVSEDRKTYTFKLRKDAKWNNGDPVTAHDFIFAWTTAMKKETASNYGFILYDNILNGDKYFAGKCDESELGCKAIDDYTLEITFKQPIPYALNLLAFTTYLPINQKLYEAAGTNAAGDSLYNTEMNLMGYNGPYKITSWSHNSEMILEKNENYYDPASVTIPKIKFTMMNDANTRMNAFQGGQSDSIVLNAQQIEQMKAMNEPIYSYVDNSNWYFQYNLKSEAMKSPKVRKALGDAIDPQSFIDNVLKDGSALANGLVPTSISGANNGKYVDGREDLLDHDLEGAKALFDEGLKELNLKPEDVKLTYVCDDTTDSQVFAAYFQQQWKKVLGINVEIKPLGFQARLDAMRNGNFDIVLAGWSPDYDDAMTFLDMFMVGNGNNYGKYDNQKYNDLLKQAMEEPNAAKRQELLHQAEAILIKQDWAAYPIFFQKRSYVQSNKVQGVTRTGFQEFDFCDGAQIVK